MTELKLRTGLAALALLASVASAEAQNASGVPQNLPAITLQAGMHNIRAQVALTDEQWQIGLMHRRQMAQHEGMLFVSDHLARRCFWMLNTLLPLSIAFLADDGTVVNVEDGKPQTLDSHCSAKPVRYVLEMNQGWFDKRGIKPGFKLSGPPFTGAGTRR